MFLPLQLGLATSISLSYVGFLYAFDYNGCDRNDPKSIKRRFCGAVVNNTISILATYLVLAQHHAEPFGVMGIHLNGIYFAALVPFILTSCCYLGNWVMIYYDGEIQTYFDLSAWKQCFQSLPWFRDNIMAPITEELAFRACTATLVREIFSSQVTVVVAPLPFSLSHFHHVLDDARKGMDLWTAFRRRENIISAIVSHSVCNSMGLPLLNYIEQYPSRVTRVTLWCSYVTGFCSFIFLLVPLTEPSLYKF